MTYQVYPKALLACVAAAVGIGTSASSAAQTAGSGGTTVVTCSVDDRACLTAAAANGYLVSLAAGGAQSSARQPATYRDVTFADGSAAFADEIVSFDPGAPAASQAYAETGNALGEPDWTGGSKCRSADTCSFLSLGRGGSIVARFTDNVLTGGGTPELDLWIFEVGPQVEDMFVEVSADGINWTSVGEIGGGKSGVDLDAYGFGPSSSLTYVRLTDNPDKDGKSGATVGADIDAIGAISSRQKPAKTCFCK